MVHRCPLFFVVCPPSPTPVRKNDVKWFRPVRKNDVKWFRPVRKNDVKWFINAHMLFIVRLPKFARPITRPSSPDNVKNAPYSPAQCPAPVRQTTLNDPTSPLCPTMLLSFRLLPHFPLLREAHVMFTVHCPRQPAQARPNLSHARPSPPISCHWPLRSSRC